MRPSEIELHIEELILEGFAPGDRYGIADALERELTRLLTTHGLTPTQAARLEGTQLDAGTARLKPGSTPRAAGTEVARTVYGGLTR